MDLQLLAMQATCEDHTTHVRLLCHECFFSSETAVVFTSHGRVLHSSCGSTDDGLKGANREMLAMCSEASETLLHTQHMRTPPTNGPAFSTARGPVQLAKEARRTRNEMHEKQPDTETTPPKLDESTVQPRALTTAPGQEQIIAHRFCHF